MARGVLLVHILTSSRRPSSLLRIDLMKMGDSTMLVDGPLIIIGDCLVEID